LSPSTIIPVAKALYLCDGCIGSPNQKTDLMGLFNALRPQQYPHTQPQFVIFAQLIGGLGQVPFFFDIRFAGTDQLVHTTTTRLLRFPHRQKVVQLAYTIQSCPFPQAGTYLVELFCDGQWVADTALELLLEKPMAANSKDPKQPPETEWHGELQEFCGPALAPDDPSLEPRVRRGRPADAPRITKKDAGNERSAQPE
jgi:hypothetical protein